MSEAKKGTQTVLVIGAGGREHALAWKLSLSPQVSRVIVAPGNAGMSDPIQTWSVALGSQTDFAAVADRARAEKVDLVVIGPDNPLAEGIVDVFSEKGLVVFGPTAAAARIEASKAFAKEVMKAAEIPTASFVVAHDAGEARRYLRSAPWGRGWVLKADGLAFGKGVHVCDNLDQGLAAIDALSAISPRLVIEEKLIGEEISWMAFCDGDRCALLDPARDYKRISDGDRGPNTGGMGAFSPVPDLPANLEERVRREVFLPALAEMKRRGTPFRGLLYAGLMWNSQTDALWVIEFNSRFGDPEAQAVVPRIEGDIYRWLEAAARGDLSKLPGRVPFCADASVYVVGAARGYPDAPELDQEMNGMGAPPDYFFAAVKRKEGKLVSSGGRVFGALGRGSTLAAARSRAYESLARVSFEGMQHRTDIALIDAAASTRGGRK